MRREQSLDITVQRTRRFAEFDQDLIKQIGTMSPKDEEAWIQLRGVLATYHGYKSLRPGPWRAFEASCPMHLLSEFYRQCGNQAPKA